MCVGSDGGKMNCNNHFRIFAECTGLSSDVNHREIPATNELRVDVSRMLVYRTSFTVWKRHFKYCYVLGFVRASIYID